MYRVLQFLNDHTTDTTTEVKGVLNRFYRNHP